MQKTLDNTDEALAAPNLLAMIEQWSRSLVDDDRSTHTIRLYRSTAYGFMRWYVSEELRPFALDDLTPTVLVGYRNYLQHQQLKATSTVNAHIAALRAWCFWLHDRGYVLTNPAARLKSIGRQAPVAPRGLSDRAMNALVRETQRTRYPERDYAIVQVLLQTGMRIGECAMLNMEDVILGERSGSALIRGGKGNKARTVPLNSSARQALVVYSAQMLGVEPTIKAVVNRWPQRPSTAGPTPLWRSQKRQRLSTSAIRRMIDHLVQSCAARKLVPPETSAHTLRHTFAMHYLKDNPGDLIGLANLLGHSSLDTTRIYGQPTSEQLAARVERLNVNAYAP